MRQLNLVAIPLLVASTLTVYAQQSSLKINIFSPAIGTLNLAHEMVVGKSSTIQMGAYVGNFSYRFFAVTTNKGYGITFDYRYYPAGVPMQGFYISPYVRYAHTTISENFDGYQSSATWGSIGLGTVVGWQWVLKEKVTFSFFLGPVYNSVVTDQSSNSVAITKPSNVSGPSLRAGMTLGLAFGSSKREKLNEK